MNDTNFWVDDLKGVAITVALDALYIPAGDERNEYLCARLQEVIQSVAPLAADEEVLVKFIRGVMALIVVLERDGDGTGGAA